MVNHYTMMISQIEVKRYVFRGWAVALASLVVSTMAHLSYCQRLTTPNQSLCVLIGLTQKGYTTHEQNGWAVSLLRAFCTSDLHWSLLEVLHHNAFRLTQRVINDLIVAGEFLFPLSITQLYNSKLREYVKCFLKFF